MTLQTLKIGNRQFVLLAKRDFQKLAAQARRQIEDDYWTQAALDAKAKARSRRQKRIAFEQIERELNSRATGRGTGRQRRR